VSFATVAVAGAADATPNPTTFYAMTAGTLTVSVTVKDLRRIGTTTAVTRKQHELVAPLGK
jgi:hypothetical protein